MPVHTDDYDEIVSKIQKKYDGDVRKGAAYEHAQRISTGSPELDLAMGGGVPKGRWTRFYGGYHSTKTMTSLCTAREAQKQGLLVAYYNAEKQWDPKFAKERIGMDVDAVTIVEGSTIEEIGDKMESLFGVVHVHILDSCSICVSEDELNADIRDWRPGITARAWGKVFRRLNERFDHMDNTVIMIDQVRTNFKTGSEDPAGGRILDHQSSMTVHFKKGSWLHKDADGFLHDDTKGKQRKGLSDQMEPAGYEVKCRVQKSRVCRPFRTATMRLDLDNLRFDREFELSKVGRHYGVITTTSNGRYEYQGHKIHGEPALRKFIKGDLSLQEEIMEVALSRVDN